MGNLALGAGLAKLIGFKIARITYKLFRYIYWTLAGTRRLVAKNKMPENYDWSVHIENIFFRHQLDPMLEESGPENFLMTHAGFTHPDEVLKDKYSLYSLSLDEAVFIEVPEHIDVCALKNGSFLKVAQYNHGQRILTVPISSFHKLADQVGGPHKPIIFLGMTSRCGSTLITRIFEETGQVRCLSEPDPFNSLAMLFNNKKLSENQLETMVRNGIRLLLKPTKQDITHYHIKIKAMSIVLMPYMKKMFPDSINLFIYREGMAVARSLTLCAEFMPLAKLLQYLGRISKVFTRLSFEHMGMPSDMLEERIKDNVLFGFLLWAVQCSRYLKFRQEGLDIRAIKYEDLCADPEYSVTKIFKYSGLPLELVPLGLKAMDADSQETSVLSWKNVHKNPLPVMGVEFQDDADALCDRLGLARHPNPCVLEGTLTQK